MHQLLSVVMMCHRLDLRVLPCGFLLCLHLFTTQARSGGARTSPAWLHASLGLAESGFLGAGMNLSGWFWRTWVTVATRSAAPGVHVGKRNSQSHLACLGLDPGGWWLSPPPSCREGTGPVAVFHWVSYSSLQPQRASSVLGCQVLILAKISRVVSEAPSGCRDSRRHN